LGFFSANRVRCFLVHRAENYFKWADNTGLAPLSWHARTTPAGHLPQNLGCFGRRIDNGGSNQEKENGGTTAGSLSPTSLTPQYLSWHGGGLRQSFTLKLP
jgi:hypothetical protein